MKITIGKRGMKVYCIVACICLLAVALAGCELFNRPPTAALSTNTTTGEAPLVVRVNASRSSDPDNNIRSYRWAFGDGRTGSGMSTSHTYSTPGTYTVTLTVTDAYGKYDTARRTITVKAPAINIPTPSPGSNTSTLPAIPFPKTGQGFWQFVFYCQANWTYESDDPGELVQSPQVSYRRLRGDCDDFATMLAGYAQAYWPYDSFVAALRRPGASVGHAVAFVRCSMDVIRSYFSGCSHSPYLTTGTVHYLPLDWSRCVSWTWTRYGGIYQYEWKKEWYDWVGKPHSLLDQIRITPQGEGSEGDVFEVSQLDPTAFAPTSACEPYPGEPEVVE